MDECGDCQNYRIVYKTGQMTLDEVKEWGVHVVTYHSDQNNYMAVALTQILIVDAITNG